MTYLVGMSKIKSYLRNQIKEKRSLERRLARLDQKKVELYTKNSVVKRYVAMLHLHNSYMLKLRDVERSIENIACRFIEDEECNDKEINETLGSDTTEQL